jgi:hypothetical protein
MCQRSLEGRYMCINYAVYFEIKHKYITKTECFIFHTKTQHLVSYSSIERGC